jgi:hypothetical protein
MNQMKLWMTAVILAICGTGLQAQTKRSDDFREIVTGTGTWV